MQGIIFYYIRSLDPVATAGNTLAIHLIEALKILSKTDEKAAEVLRKFNLL